MDRRKALKGIGLSLGYIVATPTMFGILQSCQKDTINKWTPQFFSNEEGILIQNLTNLILPATKNSPGALDVNIPQFLDLYFDKVESKFKRNYFKKGLQSIMGQLNDSENIYKKEILDGVLKKYLTTDKKIIEKFKDNKSDNLIYGALLRLRELAVWAYLNSEKVGEEFLAYDPVPGVQIGCISTKEATGGKKWSL